MAVSPKALLNMLLMLCFLSLLRAVYHFRYFVRAAEHSPGVTTSRTTRASTGVAHNKPIKHKHLLRMETLGKPDSPMVQATFVTASPSAAVPVRTADPTLAADIAARLARCGARSMTACTHSGFSFKVQGPVTLP
jgi:hypothetical protein